MKYLFLFAFILLNLLTYSQTLQGVIVDNITNEKLPYANLVLKGKNIGVYSNENGTYKFDISKANINDTLVVSLVGYYTKKMALLNYINESTYNLNFQMLPKIESLDEVLLDNKAKKYSNYKIKLSTGNRKQVFPSSVTYGSETAVLIENQKRKKGKLVELHLKLKSRNNKDYKTYQTYYRLAFYSVNELGFPGELVHFENIIIKPKIETRNYKINLEHKSIPFAKKGIFVGIETIKPDHVNVESSMYLTTPNILYTRTKNNLRYSRFHSNDWHKESRKSAFKKKLYTAPFIKISVVYEKE